MNGRLIHRDCLNAMRRLGAGQAQLIIADPPYFQVLDHAWDQQWSGVQAYLEWTLAWLGEAMRVMREDGLLYCFGQLGKREHTFLHLMSEATRRWQFTTSSPGTVRWATTSGATVSRRPRN